MKSIGRDAFYYFKSLTTINIPNSVETIGQNAFSGCSSLVNVNRTLLFDDDGFKYYYDNVLPSSIKRLERFTFDGCSSLKTIALPAQLDTIENSAFNGCSSLENVPLPQRLKYIGQSAFSRCTSIKELTIPTSVEEIGARAFYNCVGLEDIRVSWETPLVGEKNIFNVDANLKDEEGNPYGEDYIYEHAALHVEHNHDDFEETSPWMYFKKIFHPGFIWREFDINILVSGCGKVTYDDQEVRNGSSSFHIKTSYFSFYSTTLTLRPDNGCRLLSVTVNGEDKTAKVGSDGTFALDNLCKDTNVEVKFSGNGIQLKGDLTGDELVNGTDMVALVNVIMNGGNNPSADVNGDGLVNGSDMVALVNIIMKHNNARGTVDFARMAGSADVSSASGNTDFSPASADVMIGTEPLWTNGDGSRELTITLTNPQMPLTMVQMVVTLPEGLTLTIDDDTEMMAGRTTWLTHQLYTATTNDGRDVRLMLASGSNALIEGTEGGIIRLTLKADDTFKGGDIVLHDMLCTSPDLKEAWPADTIVRIESTTGITDNKRETINNNGYAYDLQGRHIDPSIKRKGVIIYNGKKLIK